MSLEKLIYYFSFLGEIPRPILVSHKGSEARRKKLKTELLNPTEF